MANKIRTPFPVLPGFRTVNGQRCAVPKIGIDIAEVIAVADATNSEGPRVICHMSSGAEIIVVPPEGFDRFAQDWATVRASIRDREDDRYIDENGFDD